MQIKGKTDILVAINDHGIADHLENAELDAFAEFCMDSSIEESGQLEELLREYNELRNVDQYDWYN